MYTQFFGLNEKPFAITPDPRYLFMSERHGEGLAHLVYGVTESGGFIQLTGEVGTGKTTLVRTLLGQLPSEADVALILNPQLSAVEFLIAICEELGITIPEEKNSTKALVDTLNRHLLEAHANGRRTILLVDEAQNLDAEVLEQLRLLTNLETAKQKLLQIILIAQPELRDKLSQTNLRQLAQRVTGRYHLEPLSREEADQYIDHRLRVAGAIGEIFEPSAKREVYRLSGGVPRLINVICDRAMLGAYSKESRMVSKQLVRRAAAEVSGMPAGRPYLKWLLPAAAVAAAGAAGIGIAPLFETQQNEPRTLAAAPLPVSETTPEPAADPPPVPVTEPEPEVGAPTLEDDLMSAGYETDIVAAMANLTALWGVDYDPQRGDGCAQVRTQGLSCLYQRGTWNVIRQLDRPVMLTLTDREGRTYRPVLVSIDGNDAQLALGTERKSYPQREISDLWFGQYLMFWRPPNGVVTAIRPGMRDANVRWLRESLATLQSEELQQTDDPEFFDADLERQLRDFQRRYRLQVDGLAGQQTQILINTLLADDGTPRLSAGH